jgi:ribonuclease D
MAGVYHSNAAGSPGINRESLRPEEKTDTMTPRIPVQLIDSQPAWEEIRGFLGEAQTIAVDLEGNGFHRYPEHLCLIQLACGGRIFLVDPLAVKDLSGLGEILRNPAIVKIFHSCENDLRALIRDFGFYTRNIFDTAVAAHFLGARLLGLAGVLKTYLDVEIPKSKAMQRQDWTVRPLSPEASEYAAADVEHLASLRMVLQERLREANRWEWVQEEFALLERLEYSPPEPVEQLFWKIKGSRLLKPRQRAILMELNCTRDQLARELNRPPFRVIPNETLLQLAQEPETDLKAVNTLAHMIRIGKLKMISDAIQRGRNSKGILLPAIKHERPPAGGEDTSKRLEILKAWRMTKGAALDLDPALLWPMRALQILAGHPEMIRSWLALQDGSLTVRQWQWRQFSKDLETLLCASEPSC